MKTIASCRRRAAGRFASAQAQLPPLNFEQAAYITCREAHAMTPRRARRWRSISPSIRRAIAAWRFPTTSAAAELAMLVRGGCTLAPDAYLFTVIDRAILAEKDKLPKR